MESYKSGADNSTFNGTLNDATNSETVPCENVSVGNGISVTVIEISADSESVASESGGTVVHVLNVPNVLDGEVNVEPDVVPDDEVNVDPDVLDDEVSVEPDVPDDEINVDPDVVLDDEVNVEPDVELDFVINDILRYMHCSCGRKRNATEAIAEYLFNHPHQGESCFCQVFSGIPILRDAPSSQHVTAQSNMTIHTGIGTTATCTHSLISSNAGSGERTADVVASSTQTIIPESEREHEESEDDEQNPLCAENVVLLLLLGLIRNSNAGLRVQTLYLSIKLHKHESTKSTCLEGKEHCCICLEDYCDGEELGKIDCGHVYHVDCIKEWIMIQNSCPICKREALAHLL